MSDPLLATIYQVFRTGLCLLFILAVVEAFKIARGYLRQRKLQRTAKKSFEGAWTHTGVFLSPNEGRQMSDMMQIVRSDGIVYGRFDHQGRPCGFKNDADFFDRITQYRNELTA